MIDPIWCVLVVMGAPDLTEAAIADLLAQSVPTRLLIVNQGVEDSFREHLEQLAEQEPERIFLWSHQPPLPSLSATWNRALRFCWACGGTEALVINNDVRLDPRTVSILQAVLTWPKVGNLLVSAVGVTPEQYEARPDPLFNMPADEATVQEYDTAYLALPKGGPDFSCFMVSKAGHEKYLFDEAFVPAFCEDLDQHRRYILGGDSERIFSINLPYLHVGGGSNTLKTMTPARRAAHEARIGQSRRYYESKWGGPVNHERWTIPFDPATDQDGVTTPDLQRVGGPCTA